LLGILGLALTNLERDLDRKILLGSLVDSLSLVAPCYLSLMEVLSFLLVLYHSLMLVIILVFSFSPSLFLLIIAIEVDNRTENLPYPPLKWCLAKWHSLFLTYMQIKP